jgi:hypothetical protein
MGSIRRNTFTKPLPDGAELFTRKGETFAKWKELVFADGSGQTNFNRIWGRVKLARGKERTDPHQPGVVHVDGLQLFGERWPGRDSRQFLKGDAVWMEFRVLPPGD